MTDKKMSKELTVEQKAKRADYMKWYREEHRDEIKVQRKKYNQEHKAEASDYYQSNKSKISARQQQYRSNNKQKITNWHKKNYQDNKEEISERNDRYRRANIIKVRERQNRRSRQRHVSDPSFKLRRNTGTMIRQSMKGARIHGRSMSLIGCSISELRSYLESRLQPGMTWDNYGNNGWHIDHIIPLSYFDFSDPEQQKRAWHYTNLQPLWARDNLRKSNKIEERQLVLL